jgi:hypothetical protein
VDLHAGITEFLAAQPRMALRPGTKGDLLIRGHFAFIAEHPAAGVIADAFELSIEVPRSFPAAIPRVTETGGRIPRDGQHHVNQHDDTLCLGSPIGLLLKIAEAPSLVGFAEACLVPYLYAVAHKLAHGGPFVFGELAHGGPGIMEDYLLIFGLKQPEQVFETLVLLGMKKRRANKRPCPCGCRRSLGQCRFNRRLAPFRRLASRPWYRTEAGTLALFQKLTRHGAHD